MKADAKYRGYIISLDPMGYEQFKYNYCHEDYDGAIDSNDHRNGHEPTLEKCIEAIDDLEDN